MSQFKQFLKSKNLTPKDIRDHVRKRADGNFKQHRQTVFFHIRGDRVPCLDFYNTFYRDLFGMTAEEFYKVVPPRVTIKRDAS